MKKCFLRFCFSLLALGFVAGCAKDEVDVTGSIYGIVTDADNGEPLRAAVVSLNPGGLSASTGSDGRYEFLNLMPGQYTVQITKADYQTNTKRITVVAGQQASGDLQLARGVAKLKLSSNVLNFGTSSNSLTFSIMNVGTSGSISWNISREGIDWLTVSPVAGTTEQGKSSEIAVTLSRDKITQNTDGVLLVNASGESHSISVTAEAGSGGGDNGSGSGDPNLKAGLVAYYTFDNGDATDSSENKLDAGLINSPEFITETASGKGKALYLNGLQEQYMNISYNPFQGQDNYSVSMWVKDFGSGILFAVTGTSRPNSYPYLIAESSGKFAFFTSYYSVTPFSYLYKDILDGKWHLISVVCKKSDNYNANRNLYIDGKLVDSITDRFDLSVGTKIQIGGNADGNGLVNAFTSNMKVDNIRIYNRNLNADEVKAIYELEK